MLTTMPKNRRLFYAELACVIVVYLFLFLVFSLRARGGPLSTDIGDYATLGISGEKSLHVYNRFFHVFLQALFMKLAGSPLSGLQFFWGFTVSTTFMLTYVNARLSTRNSRVLHGLLALLLLASVSSIAAYAGVPLVDFTAMLMVMVFTLVYILSARVEHKANLLIGVLGALLYLGLKTKETTIVSGLLLVGLAFDEDSHLSIRAFVRRSPYLIIGLISGVVIFSILSWIFLRDPFWGLRISEWQGFLHSSAPFYRGQRPLVLGNWYISYLLRGLLTPFLLYVISAARVTRRPIWKVIWLLPLTLVVFLTLTVLDAWGFIARFMLPVVPVICFLAPQFLEFDQVVTWREFLRGYAILLLGTLIILALRLQIGSWLADSAVSPAFFIVVAFFPVVLSVTLAIIFMSPRLSHRVSIVLALLIVALTIVPITANVKSALILRPNKVRSDSLFYPFSSFKSTIKFTPNMKMYISQHLWRINQGPMTADPGMAKNIDEVRFLFDMYFGVPAARDNFALAADMPMKDILHTKYNYVLITEQEWLQFSSNPENLRRAEDLYEAFYDPYGLVVLLRERESPLPSSYSECDQKPAWEPVPSMSAPGFGAGNFCCWRLLVCGPSLRSLPTTVSQQNVALARFLNLDVQGVR